MDGVGWSSGFGLWGRAYLEYSIQLGFRLLRRIGPAEPFGDLFAVIGIFGVSLVLRIDQYARGLQSGRRSSDHFVVHLAPLLIASFRAIVRTAVLINVNHWKPDGLFAAQW